MVRRLTQREMQRAYLERDASYDGVFFLAVRTTGVFCRPSCPARKPRPENVRYFDTAGAAVAAGYRACKRCRPLQTDGEPPKWVQGLLARLEAGEAERLCDADLRELGVEPTRARRYFRRHFGMTFQAYQRARRMGQALLDVQEGADLTATAYNHGYESNSGFRDAFERMFGRTPGRGREARCAVAQVVESPIGPLLICATADAVCRLEFPSSTPAEQFAALQRSFDGAVVPGTNAHLEQLRDELRRYFAGELRDFGVPLDYPGTAFQERVWAALLRIPYGQTCSYEDIGRAIGQPTAQRAVGLANGQNRIAIVIPCHRVVNKSGKLGGYGGGLWRKEFLLDLERRVCGS